MPSDYWNGRNEVFAKTFQTDNNIPADGLAGEQTFTTLNARNWGMRNLPDGRKIFVTNAYDPGEHDGIDIFFNWLDGDQLVDGYWTSYGGGKVWYPYGAMAVAASAGIVRRSELIGTGWLVTIEHTNGDTTGYFHGVPQTAMVNVGDTVQGGQPLFFCGWDTSHSSTPTESNPVHLHFTVQRDGAYMNPETWLQYADYLPACSLVCSEELTVA